MQNQIRNNLNPPPLDLSVDRYSVWRTWRKRWEDFYTITGLKNEEKSFVAATLRYTFTDETRNIYESLNLTEQEEKDPKVILEKLENISKGIVNETLERHVFNLRQQEEGEAFDDYLTELKLLSKTATIVTTATLEYCEIELLRAFKVMEFVRSCYQKTNRRWKKQQTFVEHKKHRREWSHSKEKKQKWKSHG